MYSMQIMHNRQIGCKGTNLMNTNLFQSVVCTDYFFNVPEKGIHMFK